jgi:DNA-binding response OmpR family regulator
MAFGKECRIMARILIVEDDEEMRSRLKDFLEDEGYESDSARNGSEALRKIKREPFDLILTDMRMPGLSGLDILPVVKRIQPEVSIIVITALGSEEGSRRFLEKGATFYLEKPIHFQKLKTLIHRLISLKEKKAGSGKSFPPPRLAVPQRKAEIPDSGSMTHKGGAAKSLS